MRTDLPEATNTLIAFAIAKAKEMRAAYEAEIAKLDKWIAQSEAASVADPLPGDKLLSTEPADNVLTAWKKDAASGRPKIAAAPPARIPQPEGTLPEMGEYGVPMLWDDINGRWTPDLVGEMAAEERMKKKA